MNEQVMFTPDELRDIRICIDVSMGSLDRAIEEEGDPVVVNGLTNRLMRYMALLEKVRGFFEISEKVAKHDPLIEHIQRWECILSVDGCDWVDEVVDEMREVLKSK